MLAVLKREIEIAHRAGPLWIDKHIAVNIRDKHVAERVATPEAGGIELLRVRSLEDVAFLAFVVHACSKAFEIVKPRIVLATIYLPVLPEAGRTELCVVLVSELGVRLVMLVIDHTHSTAFIFAAKLPTLQLIRLSWQHIALLANHLGWLANLKAVTFVVISL